MATVDLKPLPHREAIEYFRSKGFAPQLQRFHHLDHWREDHARNWVVAKGTRDDVSQVIRDAVDKLLSEGQTLKQAQKELAPRLQEMGWWGKSIERDPVTGELKEVQLGSMRRLRTIFDTNLRTAHAAGHWAAIQRTKRAFPYLEYVQIERPTKRHDHEPFQGKIWPVDDPIWLRIFPPNGWFCGCHTLQRTEGQMQRRGKTVSPPLDLKEKPWTNKRTGETVNLPEGVHPGFDTNPGAVWLDLGKEWDRMTPDLSPERRASERGIIQGLRLRRLGDGRESLVITNDQGLPVAMKSADVAAPEKVQMDGLELPAQATLLHSHITEATLSTPDLEALFSSGAQSIVAVSPGGSLWRAVRAPNMIARQHIAAFAQAAFAGFGDELATNPNGSDVFFHARLLWLEKMGLITYSWRMSERVRQFMDANRDLIDRLLNVSPPR